MPVVINKETFRFSSVGEKTGEKFTGDFTAKCSLSLQDHISCDRTYRDLLGGQNPAHANQLAANIAALVADLSVRIVDAPKWWLETRGGLLLEDENILGEVYEAAVNIEKKAIENRTKAAEKDKEVLRQGAEKPE